MRFPAGFQELPLDKGHDTPNAAFESDFFDSGGPMHANLSFRIFAFALATLAVFSVGSVCARAQAALLVEEPYGFFGALNPTGHNALYFSRICADTPVKLRRCRTGEMGVVLSRYEGIDGYDWLAIPVLPYLYSVENAQDVPDRVDPRTVTRLRKHYREAHLLSLGNVPSGNLYHGGWTQLVGAAYERRIYAFRFETTEEQDDALIARMNGVPNISHFDLIFNNCSDFARKVLNTYFPGAFPRSFFPDAGMTTPKQIALHLVRFARKNPGTGLTVFEIPQVPGYRRHSRANKNVAESLATTAYALPIALTNPYIAFGLAVDYAARGRGHFIPKKPRQLSPLTLAALGSREPAVQQPPESALTAAASPTENPLSAQSQASGAAESNSTEARFTTATNFGLHERKVSHE
jgi:hypothetical protein